MVFPWRTARRPAKRRTRRQSRCGGFWRVRLGWRCRRFLAMITLFLTNFLGLVPTSIGLVVGFGFACLLAFARERRLLVVERQLHGLMASAEPENGSFELLSGDALPVMAEKVEQSLQGMRARQRELDRTLSTLIDVLPDPLLLGSGRSRRSFRRARQSCGKTAVRAGTAPASRSRASWRRSRLSRRYRRRARRQRRGRGQSRTRRSAGPCVQRSDRTLSLV